MEFCWQLIVCVALVSKVVASPITNPLVQDGDINKVIPDYFDSKRGKAYQESVPAYDAGDIPIVRQNIIDPFCSSSSKIELKLRWSATLGSSMFANPVVFPSGPGGKKQIFVATFFNYLEMLGYDGYKPWGWPLAFEGSSFQGSPMLYDIDGDGTNDIGVVDKDGNMFWVRVGEFGQYLEDYHIQIPKLKIVRNWYQNLDPNFADKYVETSMFDHQHTLFTQHYGEEAPKESSKSKPKAKTDSLTIVSSKKGKKTSVDKTASEGQENNEFVATGGRRLTEDGGNVPDSVVDPYTDAGHVGDDYQPGATTYSANRMMDDGYRYSYGHGMLNESNFVYVDAHVLGSPTLADVNGDGHVEVIVAVSYYFDRSDYSGKSLDFDPSMYVAGGLACFDLQNQEWTWMVHLDLTTDKTKYKAVIYSTPTVADLNGDGRSEVIVGTSLGLLYVVDGDTGFVNRYFPMQFNQITAQVAVADLKGGPDLEIIVADLGGNLVVVDNQGDVIWDRVLNGELPFTPTIADIDGDGKLDVVVVSVNPHSGNSHIWALDGETGEGLTGFPIALPQGAKATSSAVLVDLHNYASGKHVKMTPSRYADPNLPPWTHDSAGHRPAPAPSLDIDLGPDPEDEKEQGSGRHRQGSGSDFSRKDGNNTSSTFDDEKVGFGVHLIVPSLDGHVFIIDSFTKCAIRLDVGEQVYSMPMIDDVTGDGFLDILVGTMNGQMMLFETSVPYHPLNAWPSFPRGRYNVFTHGQQGISVPFIEKQRLLHADIHSSQYEYEGRELSITFDIWDTRRNAGNLDLAEGEQLLKYTVILTKGTNKLEILAQQEYERPGRYTMSIPISPPESFSVVVGLYNEHGQYFEDVVSISIGTRFYVWIKYLVAAPVFLLCLPLLLLRKQLPSRD